MLLLQITWIFAFFDKVSVLKNYKIDTYNKRWKHSLHFNWRFARPQRLASVLTYYIYNVEEYFLLSKMSMNYNTECSGFIILECVSFPNLSIDNCSCSDTRWNFSRQEIPCFLPAFDARSRLYFSKNRIMKSNLESFRTFDFCAILDQLKSVRLVRPDKWNFN